MSAEIIAQYFTTPVTQAGLLSKIKAAWHFIGSGINAQKDSAIGDYEFAAINCVDGDFTTATGFQGNGTDKFLRANFSPVDLGLTIDNIQFIVYGANIGGSATRVLMDAHDGAFSNLLMRENDGTFLADFDNNTASRVFVGTAVNNGMLVASSPSPAMQRLNLNGSNVAFDVGATYRTIRLSTGQLTIGAYDNAGSPVFAHNASFRFAAITERMTDSELKLLYNAVEQTQVALSRSATGATAQNLIVTSPSSTQVFQRNSNDKADIKVEGICYTTSNIEARLDSEPWQTIAISSGGYWQGYLMGRNKGQYTLQVRTADNPGSVITRTYVGVGDNLLVIGQSNAAGQFNNPQPYSHPTLKAAKYRKDGEWAEYSDPSGGYIGGGSVWGKLATLLMAYTGCPVGIVNCGLGSTFLVNGQWNVTNGAAYDQALYTAKQIGSGYRAVLMDLGQTDAANGSSREDFKNGLISVIEDLSNALGLPDLKMLVASIGQVGVATTNNLNNIRLAISDAWKTEKILQAPIYWNLDLADDLHLTTDVEADISAALWFRAIKDQLLNPTENTPPKFLSATWNGSTIRVYFQGNTTALTLGASPTLGWTVTDSGGSKTVTAVSLAANNSLQLTCNFTLSGTVTISLGSGNSSAGNTIKDSDLTAPSPIEPFISMPVFEQGSTVNLFTVSAS